MPALRPSWLIVEAGASSQGRPPWARHATVEQAVDAAASVVALRGLVILPTETLYGLATIADDEQAVAALTRAKSREATKAIPLIAADRAQVEALAILPRPLAKLADAFWPGPLTIAVVPRKPLPSQLYSRHGTVGIRVSSHALARSLASRVGIITATSANLSGGAPASDVREVSLALLQAVDLVIDSGASKPNAPSTVVGIEDGKVVVYREGAVSGSSLAHIVGYSPDSAR